MAYQFDPNNPFNIRGVKISPQVKDSNPPAPKNNTNYYLIYIDIVKGSMAGSFSLANPNETGTNLTYTYTPTNSNAPTLPVPTAKSTTQTLIFPLYTNQRISQPNAEQNNLVAVLSANGTSYKGNPNSKNPPVFDQVYSAPALTCFPLLVPSETDSGVQSLIVLANTGSNAALNTGTIISYINNVGEPVTYTLKFFFNPVTDSNPGQGDAVVCIGLDSIGTNLEQFTQLYAVDTSETEGATYTLGWSSVPSTTI